LINSKMSYRLPKVEEIQMLFTYTLAGLSQDMLNSTALMPAATTSVWVYIDIVVKK
jgi:hypothetical protein